MSNQRFDLTSARSPGLNPGWAIILCGALLANGASAAPGDNVTIVRDLAGRIGPIIGAALACPDIARPRVQVIIDKFDTVITEASSKEVKRIDITRVLARNIADGRSAVTTGRIDWRIADRQIVGLEQSLHVAPPPLPAASSLVDAITPTAANAATAPTQPLPPDEVQDVTAHEIRFGIVIPFSGGAKENLGSTLHSPGQTMPGASMAGC